MKTVLRTLFLTLTLTTLIISGCSGDSSKAPGDVETPQEDITGGGGDQAGGGSSDIIDLAPKVNSVYPLNKANDVPLNTSIAIVFTKSMAGSSFSSEKFFLKDADGSKVSALISGKDQTVQLKPNENLKTETVYTATVLKGVKDTEGKALEDDFSWSFTTVKPTTPNEPEDPEQPILDTTPPEVSSTTPAMNDQFVALNSKILIQFTEPMDSESITISSLKLKKSNASEYLQGSVIAQGSEAVFAPQEELEASSKYIFEITKEVADLAGNKMIDNYIFGFVTTAGTQDEPAEDTTPPQVSDTKPHNGDSNFPINHAIFVKFSEAMDPSTINTGHLKLVDKDANKYIDGTVQSNDSEAIFTPLENLKPSTNYAFRIAHVVTDLAGNEMTSNYGFEFITAAPDEPIDTTPPQVSDTKPQNGYSSFPINHAIFVKFSEAMDPSTINTGHLKLVDKDANKYIDGTVQSNDSEAIFTPLENLKPSTNYAFRIAHVVTDLAGNEMTSNYGFEFTTAAPDEPIDTTPPQVSEIIPNNGSEDHPINHGIYVKFSETMDPESIDVTEFKLLDVTADGEVFIPGTVQTDGDELKFSPNENLIPDHKYVFKISGNLTDLAGNPMGSIYTISFITAPADEPIDTTPPTVSETIPADMQTLPINSGVYVKFSETMNQDTIDVSKFRLIDITVGSEALIPGTIQSDGDEVKFTPDENLIPAHKYRFQVSGVVEDLAGNAMGDIHTITFVADGDEDTTPPTVSETIPADMQTLPINSGIYVKFSETMNQDTIDVSKFRLIDITVGSEALIPGTIQSDGDEVKFTPDENLIPAHKYRFQVSGVVEDLAGNVMGDIHTITFVADGDEDITPPQVSNTIPTDGSDNFPINSGIVVQFSEMMDPNTINVSKFKLLDITGETTALSGTVQHSGNEIKFSPDENLIPEHKYRFQISKTVKDLAGNDLGDNYSIIFVAAPPEELEDTTPPEVSSTLPIDQSDSQPVDINIKVTFNEAMSPFDPSSVKLSDITTGSIIFIPGSISSSDNSIEFSPNENLIPGHEYKFQLSGSVTDIAGNPMGDLYEITFKTAP